MKRIDWETIKRIIIYCLIIIVIIIFLILSFYAIIFLIGVGLIVWLIWYIKRRINNKKYKKNKVIIIDAKD